MLAVRRRGRAGWGVPETMESARRWSGYVCPDCRFVFRVPRDHDGNGIVCPSCRRMLRIPTAGDTPPPLMVPLRRTAPELPTPEQPAPEVSATGTDEPPIVKRRRRGKNS